MLYSHAQGASLNVDCKAESLSAKAFATETKQGDRAVPSLGIVGTEVQEVRRALPRTCAASALVCMK